MYEIINGVSNFLRILATDSNPEKATDPLYEAITVIGPYALAVVTVLGLIYGVILGVKFAKAEDSKEKAALQKALISGIIGFLVVILLIAILYAIRGPLNEFMAS